MILFLTRKRVRLTAFFSTLVRAIQSRTSAFAVIEGLAPANFEWLARYFLAQLMGWGISAPEETDSEVMALVASAGDKGRATLQKLHRRISTSSTGEVSLLTSWSPVAAHPVTRATPLVFRRIIGYKVL